MAKSLMMSTSWYCLHIVYIHDNTLHVNFSTVFSTLLAHACTQEYVIVKFHHIMKMHDQFMGMNTIQQPFLSCLSAFYALAIPIYVLLHF